MDDEQSEKDEALLNAINRNNLKLSEKLLSEGADPNGVLKIGENNCSTSFLHCSVWRNDARFVKLLLNHKANITDYVSFHDGLSLLWKAVRNRNLEITDLLLKHGCDLEPNEEAILGEAVLSGNLEILKLLFTKSDDFVRKYGLNLVGLAVKNKSVHILEYLLTNGCDVSADKGSILKCAVEVKNVEMFELLVQHGCDVKLNSEELVRSAIDNGQVEILKLLVQNGCNVKDVGNNRLENVVWSNKVEVMDFLLNCGCDANIKDSSLLREVCLMQEGNIEIARLLLKYGNVEEFHLESRNNPNLLTKVIEDGKIEFFKLFVEYKFDVSSERYMYSAIYNGNVEIVQILLDNGCDTNSEEANFICEAIRIISKMCNSEGHKIVKLLVEHGFEVNSCQASHEDKFQRFPLHYAAEHDDEMTEYLVSKGAIIDIIDNRGRTPLMMAVYAGTYRNTTKTIQCLLNAGASTSIQNNDGLNAAEIASKDRYSYETPDMKTFFK